MGRSRGLALILVLIVLAALGLIATPFVLSMIMLERTSVAERARRQAGWGAEGVRNLAVTKLVPGGDPFERRELEEGRDATPYSDGPSEFEVPLRTGRKQELEVGNPQGSLWGVTAQDEQAKINVTTAPVRVINEVRARLGTRVVDDKNVLTIYSGRAARWIRPQKIRDIHGITVRVDEVRSMGLGARVRASKPGMKPIEATVVRNGLHQDGRHVIETRPPIPLDLVHGLLEFEQRHPVNLNSARRETLAAIFGSLAITLPGSRTREVQGDEIDRIVSGLFQPNVSTLHEFVGLVLRLDLEDSLKAAILINSVDPGNFLLHDTREGRGSVPICFTSDDTVTIEALASQNADTGAPQGSVAFREVVDLGSPVTMTRSWENQFDFDRMLGPPRLDASPAGRRSDLNDSIKRMLIAAGQIGEAYSGHPFGCRMETFPFDLEKGQPSDMTLKVGQKKTPNYVTGRAERDHRGKGRLFHHVEHFDEELDGLLIASKAYPREWERVFAPAVGRADVAAGGTEFWIRFEKPVTPGHRIRLFDIRETDETNRISIELEKGEIFYRITDSTAGLKGAALDKGWTEIRAPFRPAELTWYHVAAFWKGTRYGQMLLMIDGNVPKGATWRLLGTDESTDQSSELTSLIPKPSPSDPLTPLPLKDDTFCNRPAAWPRDKAWTVPLRIGDEIVEYDPAMKMARRGARKADTVYEPSESEHPAGAKVTLFGYTSVLRELTVWLDPDSPDALEMTFGPLLATKGRLVHGFGLCRNAILVGERRSKSSDKTLGKGANRVHFQLLSDVPGDITEWPDSGYIRIEREAIYYRRIVRETKMSGYFDLCERGRAGTEDVSHMEGIPIELWSAAVDHPDESVKGPTIVQFGEEWFGPARVVEAPPGGPAKYYWIGFTVNGGALPFGRGPMWKTAYQHHEKDEYLVPVFAAREWDDRVLRTNMQSGDPVTVMESSNHREAHRIGNAISWEELREYWFRMGKGDRRPKPPQAMSERGIQLASLMAPVVKDVPVDRHHNRILKWPSGESIGERFLALRKPPVTYGPADATLDEVKNVATPKIEQDLDVIAPASMPELRLRYDLDTSQPSGAVLVGEELIGFADRAGPGRLAYCARGWLGSVSKVHDRGDAVFHLDFLPVAALRPGSLHSAMRRIPLTQPLLGDEYRRGCVLVDDEVIGFEDSEETGLTLDALARYDGHGLLRGLFGTTPSGHPGRSMVFGIPVRYSDGFKEGQFDNRMPYFQVAHTTRDARWKALRVKEEKDAHDSLLKVHCRVKIDGVGEFTEDPLADVIASKQENGQLEIRFQLEYLPGAYWPADSWKRTWKLHEVRVDYDRNARVLFHEDE